MQQPSLVLLLPHGYEGQGPEHSSARLERFLQLSAQDNLRVANCTTAAQYFHLLRRQALRLDVDPRPLILMTPKSLLRNPLASSDLADFTNGTFMPVLDDPFVAESRSKVTRAGALLRQGSDRSGSRADAREAADHVAVVRVEQLAPFQNTAIRTILAGYPNLQEIVWLQEEPRNMGAWNFMESRLRELTGSGITYLGRPDRASPAEGALYIHNDEQARIVESAFAPQSPAPATNGSRTNGKTAVPTEPTLSGTGRRRK